MSTGRHTYLLLAFTYSAGLASYYIATGRLLQFLPALFFLFAIPVVALLGYSKELTRYWVPFILILLSYEALQGTVGSLAASKGIFSLYAADKLIWGFNLTGWLQSSLLSITLTQATMVFYTLHFPLIVITSVLIWYSKRQLFGGYVTAMTLTSYTALITFILLPTAPPWYEGVAADLVRGTQATMIPGAVASLTSMIESDKFAAFPSLHAAYAIIFAYFMIRVNKWFGLVAIPVTVGILFSTLYLGQHYLIDLIGGAAYSLSACAISERFKLHV